MAADGAALFPMDFSEDSGSGEFYKVVLSEEYQNKLSKILFEANLHKGVLGGRRMTRLRNFMILISPDTFEEGKTYMTPQEIFHLLFLLTLPDTFDQVVAEGKFWSAQEVIDRVEPLIDQVKLFTDTLELRRAQREVAWLNAMENELLCPGIKDDLPRESIFYGM